MRRGNILYINISEDIREKILSGYYPLDSLIPSENELVEEYDVSKITIRKAIQVLENEGYVNKRSGVGTRVISDRLFNNLSKAKSFSTILEQDGKKLEKEILDIKKIQIQKDDDFLYQNFGHEAFKLTRTYYLDNQPFVHFTHYLPAVGTKEALNEALKDSLYKWLASFGKYPANFKDAFKVVALENQREEVQEFLKDSEDFVLERTRKTKGENNEIIEISIALYDTNQSAYLIDYEI